MGAPISVWINFEVSEVPALLDALGAELARLGPAEQMNGRTVEPKLGVDPPDWHDHVAELQRMRADVAQARPGYLHERFEVRWPTVMARGVLHGAVTHAERRVAEAAQDAVAATQSALDAARRTLRDYEKVDNGDPESVWL